MDTRCSPPVLRHHAPDEITQLTVGARSSSFARDSSPVGAIRPSVPSHNCGRLDDHQGRSPVCPHLTQRHPERTIGGEESRTSTAVSGNRELLSQGEVLQHQGMLRNYQRSHGPEDQFEGEQHCGSMQSRLENGKSPFTPRLSIPRPKCRGWDFGEAPRPGSAAGRLGDGLVVLLEPQ